MSEPHEPIAERNEQGAVRIRWAAQPDAEVYFGTDPAEIFRNAPVARLENGVAILRTLDPACRHFYELVPADGSPSQVIGERLLPLAGANNFRDLGGYETRDGRRVRWGRIFRSDHLADLTPEDLSYLGGLGIRMVCDFRGDEEVAEKPNRLPVNDPPRQINPAILGTALQPSQIRDAIMTGNPEGLDFRNLLIDGNRRMATGALDQFRALFRHLEDEQHVPLLFHCTAGKDRTGLAAALILLALDVPEETVMSDYLLTATYTHDFVEKSLANVRFANAFELDLDEIRPLMSVRREFLQAAIDGIHEEFGDVDRYFDEAMEITPAARKALQGRFLR